MQLRRAKTRVDCMFKLSKITEYFKKRPKNILLELNYGFFGATL